MRHGVMAAALLCLCQTSYQALAQAPAETTVVAPIPANPATTLLPAGTVVEIELAQSVSSKSSTQGQAFGLRLAEPIIIEGRIVVAAGATGGGEVIDAKASGIGGRQGKLVISGRYLDIGGQRATIRGMTIMAAGKNRAGTSLALSTIPYAGIAGIFVHGGEIEIPEGARGFARLAVAIEIPTPPVTVGETKGE